MDSIYKIMIGAWAFVIIWVIAVIFMNRKQHPAALFCLFMVELWERFSYYGMRAMLVLYVTKTILDQKAGFAGFGGFGMSKDAGYGIYGAYGALVYLTPLLGGVLADRLLGFRKSIVWGAILMAAGQFALAGSAWGGGAEITQTLRLQLAFFGLGLLVMGNGFFKPNISSLIGRFYQQGDPRRDGAFTIFYMGINMGAFLAPLTATAIGEKEGWQYGFLLAGIGMVLGLIIFLVTVFTGVLQQHAEPPKPAPVFASSPKMWEYVVYGGTFLFVGLSTLLIYKNDIVDIVLIVLGLLVIAYMIYDSFQYTKPEQQRIFVILILLFFTAVFWTFFELAGSALTIFTDRHISKNLFGLKITTGSFQSVNAFFIIIFAPLFSYMWTYLGRRKLDPNAAIKFAIGLLLLGLGFLLLSTGKQSAKDFVMPSIFMIGLYLLHTLGELALSPVGLSLVTKLAPGKIVGMMMGIWFLSSSIAHQAGKHIAKLTEVSDKATPQETFDQALKVFNQCGFFAIACAALLLLISPLMKKWMHGVR
ncbi:MAG: peptide MFS transporter [Zavarzinella sp.]